jgi:hypothetical protein
MCSVSTLQFCPCEVDNTTKERVSWHWFEKVWVGRLEDSKDWHALHLEYKQTTLLMFITLLKPKLIEFVVHNFEAKW